MSLLLPCLRLLRLLALLGGSILLCAGQPASTPLKLIPLGALMPHSQTGYIPTSIPLQPMAPPGLRRLPSAQGPILFGSFQLGNGPRSRYWMALAQSPGQDPRLIVDRNQNGDFSDDGDGIWPNRTVYQGKFSYGRMEVLLRASYGTPIHETHSTPYALSFYHNKDDLFVSMFRGSLREGTIRLDGQTWPVRLVENDSDAIFSGKPASTSSQGRRNAVWLLVDAQRDGRYRSGMLDIRNPFELMGKVYEARVAVDGSRLTLVRSSKPALDSRQHPERPLLPAGTPAPDVTLERLTGPSLRLSALRGRPVLIVFWGHWSQPSRDLLVHLGRLQRNLPPGSLHVLPVCSANQRTAASQVVSSLRGVPDLLVDQDTGPVDGFAYDSFRVSSLPTSYLIDAQGRIVDSFIGYNPASDTRIEKALRRLGLRVQ